MAFLASSMRTVASSRATPARMLARPAPFTARSRAVRATITAAAKASQNMQYCATAGSLLGARSFSSVASTLFDLWGHPGSS